MKQRIRSTTILCVRRDGKVVMAGDGQVTLGSEVLKSGAKKLRRLYNSKILAGFAGATADAFALFTRFESKLEQFNREPATFRSPNWRRTGEPTACCASSGGLASGRRSHQYLHRQRQW